MSKLKALIVGSGNIGAFFDNPESENIATHAHAYTVHSQFELLGFVDPNFNNAKNAAKIWGGKPYKTIDQAFNDQSKIDVISVCVPDEFHGKIIKEIASKPVRFIFAEKPITKSLHEAREVIGLCKKNKIALQVNYSRRFLPEILDLAKEIKSGYFGGFVSGTGLYGKGIMHNGSHMVDLIRYVLGEIKTVRSLSKINDCYSDDPTVSAILTLDEGGRILLQGIDCNKYTIFELDLLFEKGRVSIKNSGNIVEKSIVEKSKLFKGYHYLTTPKQQKTSLQKAMYLAIDNIFEYLSEGKELHCTKEEGYLSLKTAIQIKEAK